jgi:hypothetical protein
MKVRFLETNSGDACDPSELSLLPDTLEVLVINELHIQQPYDIRRINLPTSLKYLFINGISIEEGIKDNDFNTISIFLERLKVPFNCKVYIIRYYSTEEPKFRKSHL